MVLQIIMRDNIILIIISPSSPIEKETTGIEYSDRMM